MLIQFEKNNVYVHVLLIIHRRSYRYPMQIFKTDSTVNTLVAKVTAPEYKKDRGVYNTDAFSNCHWHIKARNERHRVGLEVARISAQRCDPTCVFGFVEIKNRADWRPTGMRFIFVPFVGSLLDIIY